jgi:uncharacterized phage protein (TIGR01671 family)
MRELKFRVWNKATKSWLNETAGTHCWSEYSINIFTGEIVEFVTGDNKFFSRADEPSFYFDKTVVVKESPYVIQQYTGIKDKNGKEIYEGDLINYTCVAGEGDYQKEINQEVFFEDGMFLFDRNALFSMGDSNFLKQSIEVVGNIFENPELLKA